MKAVILAGGRGTRLLPYTTVIPKPLMPLGDDAVLDVVLRQLARNDFDEAILAVGYHAELVMAYVGDGSRLGIPVRYVREDEPLGTAGPIGRIEVDEPFLVMNGDVLADVDFRRLREAHEESRPDVTVVLAPRTIQIDLGVLDVDGDGWVTSYREKPVYDFVASAGIYVFDPSIRARIPDGRRVDLPDLILELIGSGGRVRGFRHEGYWLDIGRHDDYERAQNELPRFRQAILARP